MCIPTTIVLNTLLKKVKSLIKNMAKIVERLSHDCYLQPGKANVVVDSLSRMTMGSVSSVDEYKKDLVKDVHRLALVGDWNILKNVVLWSVITPNHLLWWR